MSLPPSKTHKISGSGSPHPNDIWKSPSDIYNLDGKCDDENGHKTLSPEKAMSSTPTSPDDFVIAEAVKGFSQNPEDASSLYPEGDTEVVKNKRSEESSPTSFDITIQMGEIEDASKFVDELFQLHTEAMRYMHQTIIRFEA